VSKASDLSDSDYQRALELFWTLPGETTLGEFRAIVEALSAPKLERIQQALEDQIEEESNRNWDKFDRMD
jgi:hypothetical protein